MSPAVKTIFIVLFFAPAVLASKGLSIGIGAEYTPLGKIEYSQNGIRKEVYDNLTVESGIYYNLETGFRVGAFFAAMGKKVELSNSSSSDISLWGVGLLGDYEYEITETGTTRLVFGLDSGYARFKEKNSNVERSNGSFWVAGFGGVRYFFTDRYFFEFDYRMKLQEFNLVGVPEKTYIFSGSNIRISLGYGFFTGRTSMRKIR